MNQRTAKRLLDAAAAATNIALFCEGKTFDDYRSDPYFRSAVERPFEILAEALNVAAREEAEVVEWFPEIPEIVGLRNQIAHAYSRIDD